MPVKSAKDLAQAAGLVAEPVNPEALVPVDSRAPKKQVHSSSAASLELFGSSESLPDVAEEDADDDEEEEDQPKPKRKPKAKAAKAKVKKGPKVKAKAKAGRASSSSAGRKAVDKDKYTTAYQQMHAFPAAHIYTWLRNLDPDNFGILLGNRLDKPTCLAYLFLMTGICPSEKPPGHEKEVIESECSREYKRLGMPLKGDEFLEPEIAIDVSKTWMMKHVTQGPDGFVLPLRVRHPGKEWIIQEAKKFKISERPSFPAINFFTPGTTGTTGMTGTTGTTGTTASPTEIKGEKGKESKNEQQQQQDEFKILYRDGGHRLLRLSFLGKRLGDVPLPSGSNFKIVVFEGRQVLSAKGGSEMYDCEEYMDVLMPPVSAGGKASTEEVFTYKIAFAKGTFILRCIDSKGKIAQQALLDSPKEMFNIKTENGVDYVQDGDELCECKFFFMSNKGPSQHSWEVKSDGYKISLLKFNAKKEVLETMFLPEPKDYYLIEYDTSGVAWLKDGDKVVKSCEDMVAADVAKVKGESWEIAHTDGKYSLVKFDAEKKELQKALLSDPKDNYLIEYDSSGVAMLKDDDKVTACQDVVDEILESDGSTGGKVADADLTDEAESHGLKRKYSRLELPA